MTDNMLYVTISQSGETRYTLEALRAAKSIGKIKRLSEGRCPLLADADTCVRR